MERGAGVTQATDGLTLCPGVMVAGASEPFTRWNLKSATCTGPAGVDAVGGAGFLTPRRIQQRPRKCMRLEPRALPPCCPSDTAQGSG